jgi:hypothetical protein
MCTHINGKTHAYYTLYATRFRNDATDADNYIMWTVNKVISHFTPGS